MAASMEDNTAYQISQVLFSSSRSGSTFSCEPFHQRMVHPEQVSSITQQMERLQRQTTLATQSEVPDNSDPTGVLAMINDPSPFSCDIASIIDECVTEMSIRTSYLEEAVKTTAMEAEQSQELPSSTSSSLPKKPAKKRKRKPPPNKIYECNWCRKAEFKSGQGLRFHKVLRCPVRETQLGEFSSAEKIALYLLQNIRMQLLQMHVLLQNICHTKRIGSTYLSASPIGRNYVRPTIRQHAIVIDNSYTVFGRSFSILKETSFNFLFQTR